MYHFIDFGNEAFILFLFPLIGLVLQRMLSLKVTYWVLGIAFILFSPILLSYQYTIPYAFRTLLLIITSAAFALGLRSVKKTGIKILLSSLASVAIFFLFLASAFFSAFVGLKKVKKTWNISNYRIELISQHGFAGEPVETYRLTRYTSIPLLIKHEETMYNNDRTGSCYVWFMKAGVVLDKCRGTVDTGAPDTGAPDTGKHL